MQNTKTSRKQKLWFAIKKTTAVLIYWTPIMAVNTLIIYGLDQILLKINKLYPVIDLAPAFKTMPWYGTIAMAGFFLCAEVLWGMYQGRIKTGWD